jgi:hypothetical protein
MDINIITNMWGDFTAQLQNNAKVNAKPKDPVFCSPVIATFKNTICTYLETIKLTY